MDFRTLFSLIFNFWDHLNIDLYLSFHFKSQRSYFSVLGMKTRPGHTHGVGVQSLIIDKCLTFTHIFCYNGLNVNENNRSHRFSVISACGVAVWISSLLPGWWVTRRKIYMTHWNSCWRSFIFNPKQCRVCSVYSICSIYNDLYVTFVWFPSVKLFQTFYFCCFYRFFSFYRSFCFKRFICAMYAFCLVRKFLI